MSDEKRSFVCSFDGCDKSYIYSCHLKRHEESHDGTYRCTEKKCGMNFKTKFTLKKHVDNVHLKKKPKKYKCQDCGEEFNKHNWLTSHRYKHTGVKPYECSVEGCGKRFPFPSRLKCHMKIHEGYRCTKENCSEHFSTWTLYTRHLKVSHPAVYKCNYCEKEFARSNNLKTHLEAHKLDREVFLCPKPSCSRFYFMEKNLIYHIKSYHDKRPFNCTKEHCPKAFISEAAMNAHIDRHHSNKRKKRKKKKSKPSLAATLAGLAPKKWQMERLSEPKTDVIIKSSEQNTAESKECETRTGLSNTCESQQTLQLTVSKECQEVPHLICAEKRNDTLTLNEVEDDSCCSTSSEIRMLLSMIEKRGGMLDNESNAKKIKCIFTEA